MRGLTTLSVALLLLTLPAKAEWRYWACPVDSFASKFPAEPKQDSIKFTLPRHGEALSARTYTTIEDNVVYKVLVADYSDRKDDGASILEEAMFQHTDTDDDGLRRGTIVANDSARIEPVPRGATYGRRIAIDLPNNGGRNLTNFYFRNGKLYKQSSIILPANGDYANPDASRFVESLMFNLTRMQEETDGIPPNIVGCGTKIEPFEFKPQVRR
jgi:hypothetical protein